MGKATIVRVDGSEEELGHRPTLKEAQEIVGGWIEFVGARNKMGNVVTLVIDEEGKLKGKPKNSVASIMYWSLRSGTGAIGDIIVGDVIVLEGWKTVGS